MISEATLLSDSNPFTPLNALLLINTQLKARIVALNPPPTLDPKMLPEAVTITKRMVEDNTPANARAIVPNVIRATTNKSERQRNNIPLPVPKPEKYATTAIIMDKRNAGINKCFKTLDPPLK